MRLLERIRNALSKFHKKPLYEAELDRNSKYLGDDDWLVGGPGGYIVHDPDGPQG